MEYMKTYIFKFLFNIPTKDVTLNYQVYQVHNELSSNTCDKHATRVMFIFCFYIKNLATAGQGSQFTTEAVYFYRITPSSSRISLVAMYFYSNF